MGGTITSVLGFRSFAPAVRMAETTARVREQKVVFASGDTTTRAASLAGAMKAQAAARTFTGKND